MYNEVNKSHSQQICAEMPFYITIMLLESQSKIHEINVLNAQATETLQ